MNTSGVPCTIKRLDNKMVESTSYIKDKQEQFSSEMESTQDEFVSKIDNILELLDGNLGKKKKDDIASALKTLKSHISSNTGFVLDQFDRAMDKTVTEAKQSVSSFIEHKIHSLGLEGMREQLQIDIDNKKEIE